MQPSLLGTAFLGPLPAILPHLCSGVFAQSQRNNPGTPSCLPHLFTSASAVSFSSDSWISAQGPDMPGPPLAREHLSLEFHLLMPTPFSSSEKHPFGIERRTFRHKGKKEGQPSPRERKRSPAGSRFSFSNSQAPSSFSSKMRTKGPGLGLAGKPPGSQLNFTRLPDFQNLFWVEARPVSSVIRAMAGGLTEARPVMYPMPSPAGLGAAHTPLLSEELVLAIGHLKVKLSNLTCFSFHWSSRQDFNVEKIVKNVFRRAREMV